MILPLTACLYLLQTTPTAAPSEDVGWNQWGGPERTFRLPDEPLATEWPDEGPRVIWTRELAGGYGGLALADSTLFALVRQDEQEIAVALSCEDGSITWQKPEPVPIVELDYGMGPFATPLVGRDRVFFLGATGSLRAHRRSDGELLWRRDLERDYPGPRKDRGHAPSPLIASGLLIIPVGAPGAAVVALDPRDGTTRWRRHDFGSDYASPITVRVGDTTQLICHMEEEVIGLDPRNGALLWALPSPSERTQHTICPLDLDDGELLVSTTYGLQRLIIEAGTPRVRWASRGVKAQVGNLLFLPDQDMILGATSAYTGSPLAALDAETGRRLWRDRGIDCGYLWSVGDRLLGLDSGGTLVMARATRSGLEVMDESRVLSGEKVWSAPAMRGTTLFVKDQDRVVALDLGR